MLKKIIPVFVFLISVLVPQYHISANENSIYYNEEYKYTISFPKGWYIFSEEMKQSLSPEERKYSPAIFIREDGTSQMFIRHLPPQSERYKLYKNVIDYIQKTPKEKQKIRRQLNPISTALGRTINDYHIDELNETIELQLSQTSSQFGEIYTTIFWKEFKGTLIELEFYHFEKNDTLLTEAEQINRSFTISPEALKTNMKEGSMKLLNNISLSKIDHHNNAVEKIINIINQPIVWIIAASAIVLLILLRLIYRLI